MYGVEGDASFLIKSPSKITSKRDLEFISSLNFSLLDMTAIQIERNLQLLDKSIHQLKMGAIHPSLF